MRWGLTDQAKVRKHNSKIRALASRLTGIYFAYLPVRITGGSWLWWEYYYKSYATMRIHIGGQSFSDKLQLTTPTKHMLDRETQINHYKRLKGKHAG